MQFADIIGQHSVKQRLLHSAKDGRISHAQLFLGPEGSGNLAMAMAYAQYLVCEQPGEDDSCGTCSGCLKMGKMVHPDVTYSYPVAGTGKPKSVDFVKEWREAVLENPYLSYNQWVEALNIENKQGIISVDEAADIVNRLSLKSVESPYKVVIIWYPEALHTSAANKLLKILEEPTDNTLFFLVAEQFEQLLPTIVSRTQLVKVNRITDADMLAALTGQHSFSAETARRIIHRANGNYNVALKIIGNDEGENDLNQWFIQWMRACYKPELSQIVEMSEEFNKVPREVQKIHLEHAQQVARECLLINYADKSLVRLEGKDLEGVTRFAPFVNSNNAEQFVGELNKASYHVERNANSRILFTDLSLTIHRLLHIK